MWIGFVCLIVFYLIGVLWAFIELKNLAKEDPESFLEELDIPTIVFVIFIPVWNLMCAYVLAQGRYENSQNDKKWIKDFQNLARNALFLFKKKKVFTIANVEYIIYPKQWEDVL